MYLFILLIFKKCHMVDSEITYGPKVSGKNSVADNSYKNSSIFLPNFQTISLNYSYYKTTFK
jgi:hypothetical protein